MFSIYTTLQTLEMPSLNREAIVQYSIFVASLQIVTATWASTGSGIYQLVTFLCK